MKQPKLTYALKDGVLVHISSVDSGLSCGCVCPACHGVLEAKKGVELVHHFAHYKGKECAASYETSIHLLAKEVIAESKAVFIPAVSVFTGRPDWVVSDSKLLPVDSVVLETALGDIVPDVIVVIGDRKLLIEIKVTHGIDAAKLERIRSIGLSCIEVDLSKLKGEITKECLAENLLANSSCAKWIFNALVERYKTTFLGLVSEIPLERHGYALHAMGCPMEVKTWHGKRYANVIDHCSSCKHYFDMVYDNEGEAVSIRCSAALGYYTLQEFKNAQTKKQCS